MSRKLVLNTTKCLVVVTLVLATYAFTKTESTTIEAFAPTGNNDQFLKLSVEEALIRLGDTKPQHYLLKADADSARMGLEIITNGRLLDKSNSRISKFFVCADCHNRVLESSNPADESPAAVLEYSKKNNLSFLPAATFYGVYNKRHWYNGDYQKKYGDLVVDAKDTLENAIQLCATQCSQGRKMVDWELRAILHYFKSVEYKLTDLVFSKPELAQVEKDLASNKKAVVKLLKTKYSETNEATFGTSEMPKIEGYEPSLEDGGFIYQNGCLHCHATYKEIANFDLGMDKLSFKFLVSKLNAYNQFSISHITRYGTYAMNGRRQYMPQYTMENMSDEQMLDLIHFIKTKAAE